MALKEYQAKRKFDRTPEPAGKRRSVKKTHSAKTDKKALRFVIQKHAASHLHYDFRLELDGVLKSWAIPKGPSLNPEDRHLAIQVEDHPLEYRTFEGIIPEGNYGAGTVMLWDEGEYYVDSDFSHSENEKAMREGLENGKLTFILQGKKLQGEFALVHMKGNARYPKENSWLLIKADDRFASDENILSENQSATTGRSMDEIERGEKASKAKTSEVKLDSQLKTKMPHHIKPMLTTLIDEAFDKPDWIFEIKWDGYRAIAEIQKTAQKKSVSLYSRNFLSFEQKFPVIVRELGKAEYTLILDGEVVALDDQGKPNFQLLQDYENNQDRIVYTVFDLLYIDEYDIRDLPLKERKELLKQYLPSSSRIRYCDHVFTQGIAFFDAAVKQGLEGIIAKDAYSPYSSGKRTSTWLKIKTHQRQEAIICGFTAPRGGRKEFGALILGAYDNQGTLKYIGHTGTGMDTKTLQSLRKQFTPLITSQCPFEKVPKTNEKPTWLKPKLVCEISFTEWTQDNSMRHPVYMGLRPDKSIKEICIETAKPVEQLVQEEKTKKQYGSEPPKVKTKPKKKPQESVSTTKFAKEAPDKQDMVLTVHRHKVTVSNPNRLLWPGLGYRKKDLVEYYRSVASYILPYLQDRPFVLHRYPSGITGEDFYQKDMTAGVPDWVETIDIYSESNAEHIRYVICRNEETLIWLANLACIEMNPWNSRKQNLEYPDWMVIDLDPQDIGFEEVIKAAQVVHRILDDWKIPNFCKTSGATGLHIYVPLAAKYHYDTVRDFGQLVAAMVHQELPKTTSLERSPSKRRHKIYLDYLQNRYGQTLVAPYSLRPTPEATVSTPLRWDEVKTGLSPTQFTLENIGKRLKETGDLWAPVIEAGINLEKLMNRLLKEKH